MKIQITIITIYQIMNLLVYNVSVNMFDNNISELVSFIIV